MSATPTKTLFKHCSDSKVFIFSLVIRFRFAWNMSREVSRFPLPACRPTTLYKQTVNAQQYMQQNYYYRPTIAFERLRNMTRDQDYTANYELQYPHSTASCYSYSRSLDSYSQPQRSQPNLQRSAQIKSAELRNHK